MAKDKSDNTEGTTTQATPTTTETNATTQSAASAAAQAATPGANQKHVKLVAELSACPADNVLKLPASDTRPIGTTMPRASYIKHRWAVDKVDRGQITRDLNAMNVPENGGTGNKIPYQVVFAVIKKGTPGGPDKATEAPAANTAAAA
jgi:hypothetical protein